MSFAHLHVHTEYSLLDGMSRIDPLVQEAVRLGMESLAITDHGNMYGVIEFYRACKKHGVKPIIGMEAYLSPRSMTDRDPKLDSSNYHLLLLAKNQTGYKNLLKIASASQLEGFYYRPRIDKDYLAAHAEGLICTTGCLAAEIPQLLLEGREKEAHRWLGWYQDVFGPENFYIELQDHNIPELRQLNRVLVELGTYAEIPLLATNDVHYVRQEDADPHDVLLCIGTSGPTFFLRSPEEMRALFAEAPEALDNTLKVAEMCQVNLDSTGYHLPNFPVPEGHDAQSYLRTLCEEGLRWRYGDRADDPTIRERLERELAIIHDMGFDTYFLIVWDLCDFARSRDIWWNVRGSGAGSVVAFSLGITNIDPLQNQLLFERFLNPGRVSMPDIDLDYPDDQRAEMIEYCVRKYGEDKVAQIITFGTLGARAAVRDVGRALDIPLNEVDQLARLIPSIPGKPVTIRQALDETPELREMYEDSSRPYIKELLDTACKLEGVARHASTHAAGVLIADKPLIEYTPLNRPTKGGDGGNGDGLGVVSQWPMEIVESIGLLKVDFLGLRTLTIMRKACELIERYHGVRYDLNTIPYHHKPDAPEENAKLDKAFELLTRGETSGVFQLEGTGMTNVITEMKPSRFEHIIAAISLFRPGPIEYIDTYIRRMHNEEEVKYHHPKLQPILEETYGIIIYQESIMQIASELFGYNLGDADLMRRAVAKKKEKDLKKHRAIFQQRGPEHGVPVDIAGRIFDDIEFFARYGFNKSHAADYAMLTVQTAFLKAHYPHEYMTALLTVERGDTDKVGGYIADCRRMGIEVLPPHINLSEHDFTIEDQADGKRVIRYGLSAVKNVGGGAVEAILAERGNQPFEDLADFCSRVDLRAVGKRALESLIKVGALDCFGERLRLANPDTIDNLMKHSTAAHRAAEVGQLSLFGEATGVGLKEESAALLAESLDVPRRELLQWERDLVGVYVSAHPLQSVMDKVHQLVNAYSSQLGEADHDRQVTMIGMVKYVRRHTTKTGKSMAFAGFEDLYGPIEVVVWPNTWDETHALWEPDRILLVRGRIDASRGEPKLLCDEATNNFAVYEAVAAPTAHEPTPAPVAPPPYYESDYNKPPPPDWDVDMDVEQPDEVDEMEPLEESMPAEPEPPPAEQVERGPEPAAGTASPQSIPTIPIQERPAEEACQLLILIRRGADRDRDRRRLERVHGLLISYHGADRFALIVEDGKQRVRIDFPNDTTHYCSELAHKLADILGPDAIQVLPEQA